MPDAVNEQNAVDVSCESRDNEAANCLASTLAWDGLLPTAVGLAPILVKLFLPRRDAVEVLTIVLLPAVAALVRASFGHWQLRRVCGGFAPLGRQVALGSAIVCLLLSESLFAVLVFAADAPREAWLFPAGSYLAYLTLILVALRPPLGGKTNFFSDDGPSTRGL